MSDRRLPRSCVRVEDRPNALADYKHQVLQTTVVLDIGTIRGQQPLRYETASDTSELPIRYPTLPSAVLATHSSRHQQQSKQTKYWCVNCEVGAFQETANTWKSRMHRM